MVGISVSGGGLRAAAFGLGALQALQHERGLLRGERAARYLSAVSGGSYIAGAYTLLNCSDRIRPAGAPPDGRGAAPSDTVAGGALPPYAPGSPEAEHLRRHCRYMIDHGGWKTSAIFFGLIVLNLLVAIAVVAWAGAALGYAAAYASAILPGALHESGANEWLQWAIAYLVRRAGNSPMVERPTRRGVLIGVAVPLLIAAGSPTLVARLREVPLLADPDWLLEHLAPIAVGLAAVLAVIALSSVLSRYFRYAAALQVLRRLAVGLLALRAIQAIGILIVAWLAVWVEGEINGAELAPLSVLVILVLLAAPLFTSRFVDRASPHHVYRDLLNDCFSVVRDADGEARKPHDPRDVPLSRLDPPLPGGAGSFPELMICAAVNVSDIGATPAGSNALSLVFTPQEMRIPACPGQSVPIEKLERFERPTDLARGWGSAINLSSAVAMTGAALSPAMGKMTRGYLRALLATLNVRLGVWLPNPLSEHVRARLDRPERVKVGMLEFVRELFGFHPQRADKLYVTDGGHYDNLGLVELLRQECETIWCIDASGDPPGRATALSEALLTAGGELGARVTIDLDAFGLAADSLAAPPEVAATHAIGEIHYAKGGTGTLIVVKLGIGPETPSELREYRRNDRPFPYHSTVNQIYRAERFDAYRALGWASAQGALAQAPPQA